jgi:hypothetical protein
MLHWGKNKLKTCTRKKKDVAFGGTLAYLDPKGPFSSTWTLAVEGPGRHHHRPRFHFGGIYEPGGTCGHHLGPMEAKRPTFLAQRLTYEPQRHPRRA